MGSMLVQAPTMSQKYSHRRVAVQQLPRLLDMHALIEGKAKVDVDGEEKAMYKEVGKFFGEKALESGDPRLATVTVTSALAKIPVVDKQWFEMPIGPLKDAITRGKDGSGEIKKVAQCSKTKEKAESQLIACFPCGGLYRA